MSTSEAVSGNINKQDPALSYRERALILTALTALLWFFGSALTIADAALGDRIPDPVPTGLTILAATATIGAIVFWARVATARELAALNEKVGTYWTGYTAGVEDVNVNGKVIDFPATRRD